MKRREPRFQYDPVADAVYVKVADGAFDRTEHLDHARHLDVAKDGTVLGVELLYVSRGVDTVGLPEQAAIEKLLSEHGIRAVA